MKLITAVIQTDKLDQVREALIKAEITRITVSRVTGHGQQEDIDIYRGQEVAPNLIPKIRLDVAVNDAFVDITVDTIITSALHGSGEIGDGLPSIGEVARAVFGKAMVSRRLSDPTNSMTRRSSPRAIPPCGGAPYSNERSRKPNFVSISSSLKPT